MSKLDGRQLSIKTQTYLRQQAIRLREQGKPVGEIADYLGVNRSVVGKWWRQYKAAGEAALRQQPRGRRIGLGQRLSEAQQTQLRSAIETGYPEDYGIESALWTRRAVQALIAQHCDVKLPVRKCTTGYAEHKHEIEDFYLPAYSPDLNPAEYLNNDVKQQVHNKPPTMSVTQLKKRTASVLPPLC